MPFDASHVKDLLANAEERISQATDEEREKVAWDAVLDIVEDLVEQSKTKIDDIIVKPIIAIIRNRFAIPD